MPTVKIGVFEPLTGDSGAGGKQEMLGMQYAHSLQPTVMIGDTEYAVELVPADNASDSSKAPTAASTLVSEGVSIVLGTYGSSSAIAAGPIFEQAQIPAIGVTCTNPQVTVGNEFYFRTCFIDPFQGTVLANYASEQLGATKVYTLGEAGNDYDTGVINYFTEAFEGLGGTTVADTFQTNNSDFTSYLNKGRQRGRRRHPDPCLHRLLHPDHGPGQGDEPRDTHPRLRHAGQQHRP